MFIRFSEQENINEYTITAVNTAGSQRLQDGTKIMGALVAKENILVWTDNALYTMKFVGAPFTFGFEQVGTNCGLIGKNLSLIHISEPTRLLSISYAVFCLKKKKK